MALKEVGIRLKVGADGLENLQSLSRGLQKAGVDTSEFDAKAAELSAELRKLGQEQGLIDSFVRQKDALKPLAEAYAAAQAKAQALGREIAATDEPTKAQTKAFAAARAAVNDASQAQQAAIGTVQSLRAKLGEAGVSTDDLAAAQVRLRQQMESARQGIAGTVGELEQLAQQRQAVQTLQGLAEATEQARQRVDAADRELQQFRGAIAATEEPTRREQVQLGLLSEAARQAQVAFQAHSLTQAQAASALRAAGASTETLTAAQTRGRAAADASSTAAQRAATAYQAQGAAATRSATEQSVAAKTAAQGIGEIQSRLQGIQTLAATAIGGGIFTGLIKSVADTADEVTNLRARIQLVTGAGAEFEQAFEGISQIALRTNTSLESTGTLFTRIAAAGKEIGVGQAEALALTETINQAIQLSGASAEASNAAVTQLIQGLQSGVLRGDEFNSVMEQAPRLADALAAGLGVARGQLRGLAEDGQITSTAVIRALQAQRAAIESEFGSLPATVGRALQNLSTQWSLFVADLNSGTGSTAALAAGIDTLATHLDTVARMAAVAGLALTAELAVKGVAALRALSAEMLATSGSANILAASLSRIPAVINVAIAVTGFEVGFQIGEMLSNNFALARELGAAIVGYFDHTVNGLLLLKEVAQSIFSPGKFEEAINRYIARSRQTFDNTKDLLKDAEAGWAKTGAAADKAGAATEKAGTRAAAAGAQIATAGALGAAGMTGAAKAAQTAEEAMVALAKAAKLNVSLDAGVDALADALARAALKSQAVSFEIGQALPAVLAKLSGQELEEFKTKFIAALSGAGDQVRLLQKVLQETGTAAAKSLGVDLVAAGQLLGQEFLSAQKNFELLLASLPALKATGVDTATVVAQAIGKMIDGAKNEAQVNALIGLLRQLGTEGKLGPEQVAAAMTQAADKTTQLRQKLEEATPGVQSLGEAARKAGVDMGQLTTGVSKGFQDGIAGITALATEIDKAGISAERASPILAAALDQKIAVAKTKEELLLARDAGDKFAASGLLVKTDWEPGLDSIDRKLTELSPKFKQLEKDAASLGVTTKAEVKRSVEAIVLSYENMVSSGQYSTAQLRTAFVKMARDVIEANNGIVPEWLKVEAAIKGVSITVDDFGNALVDAGEKGRRAGRDTADGFDAAGKAIDAATAKLNVFSDAGRKARNASDLSVLGPSQISQVDKQGFSTDETGKRIEIGGQVNVPEGSTFDQAAFNRDQDAFFRGGGGSIAPNPNNPRYIIATPGEFTPAGGAATPYVIGGDNRNAGRPQETGNSASSGSSHTVDLRLNGVPAARVSVASANDADVLTRFLRNLGDAASRSSSA